MLRTIRSLSALAATAAIPALADQPQFERRTLPNGVTAIVQTVPGARGVGIEAVYRVGFMDEPAGATQIAHLIEHIACRGGTASYEPDASFTMLAGLGSANAETMPTLTHYDYILPTSALDQALAVEAERLSSLRIDEAIIRQEAPRCYAEAAHLESAPQAPMLKFAMMAANQVWRHGRDTAAVKSGLEDLPLDDVRAFHRAHYRPDRLTIVVVGDVKLDDAMGLIEQRFGTLPRPQDAAPALPPVNLPKHATVRWDSTASGVMIAFPAPEGRAEQALVSAWGELLMQRFMQDAALKPLVTMISCTNTVWSAGIMPFHIYAGIPPGQDPAAAAEAIAQRIETLAAELTDDAAAAQVRQMIYAFQAPPAPDGATAHAKGRAYASRMGLDPDLGGALICAQHALRLALLETSYGADTADLVAAITSTDAAALKALVTRTLDPERRSILLILPKDQAR